MRAFVTGATGFLGRHIARHLADCGDEVVCLHRPGSDTSHLACVQWREGDIREPDSLRSAMAGCDAIYHAAAYYALWTRDASLFESCNVHGTRYVLEAARDLGIRRVVYTSSVSCIGNPPGHGPSNEDVAVSEADLCGEYKRSKLAAERVALGFAEAGLEVVITNPSSMIGPGDTKPTPTGQILVDFLNGRMPAYVDTGLNFVDVRDVAAGHRLAFERGVSGRRYILGNLEGNLTLELFLALVARVTGQQPPRFKIPYAVAWMVGVGSTAFANLTGRPPRAPLDGVRMSRHQMFFDPTRAITELGLPQTPIETAVRDAIAWFAEQGMVPAASVGTQG